MFTNVDHIGLAVEDVDEALRIWSEILGLAVTHDETVPEQGTRVIFLDGNNAEIELLGALGPDTPVGKFLAKRGPGMHHICFAVEDLEAAMEALATRGLTLIDEEPRIGAKGRRLAFVHPKSAHGVLIELYEAGSGE